MKTPAQIVAGELLGTLSSIDSACTEQQQNDPKFMKELLEIVSECDQCGWWVTTEELDEKGHCEGCSSGNDDHEDDE